MTPLTTEYPKMRRNLVSWQKPAVNTVWIRTHDYTFIRPAGRCGKRPDPVVAKDLSPTPAPPGLRSVAVSSQRSRLVYGSCESSYDPGATLLEAELTYGLYQKFVLGAEQRVRFDPLNQCSQFGM
jgi:hypothetical protein